MTGADWRAPPRRRELDYAASAQRPRAGPPPLLPAPAAADDRRHDRAPPGGYLPGAHAAAALLGDPAAGNPPPMSYGHPEGPGYGPPPPPRVRSARELFEERMAEAHRPRAGDTALSGTRRLVSR